MITKMTLSIDLAAPFVGITIKDNTSIDEASNTLPVYIPLIMGNIDHSSIQETQISLGGKTIFKNDISCMPVVSQIVKSQNYLVAKKQDNISLSRILLQDNKTKVYSIPKDTKLQCSFVHGRMSDLSYNTNVFI